MRPIVRGIAVAVAAVGIAACVKQAWRVTYPGPVDYSLGTSILVAEDGSSFMAGYLDSQQLFVAAYDANGRKRWDKVITGSDFGAHAYRRNLALDAEGNLYLRWNDLYPSATYLYKLDSSGNQVFERQLEDGHYLVNMQMGDDGNFYMDGLFGGGVGAYSADGDLLWRFPAPGSVEVPGDRELGQYEGRVGDIQVSSAGGNASTGYSFFTGVGVALANGQVYFGSPIAITLLDSTGQVVSEVTAAELGLSSIYRLLAQGDALLVIGAEQGMVTSVVLDGDLQEISRQVLVPGEPNDVIVSSAAGYTCVGIDQYVGLAGNVVQVMKLGANGEVLWFKQIAKEGGTWEYAVVTAADGACYLSAMIAQTGGRILSRTERYANAGEPTDTVALQDFAMYGVVVQGKGIYHVGITGEYDGSATIATLDKRSRK